MQCLGYRFAARQTSFQASSLISQRALGLAHVQFLGNQAAFMSSSAELEVSHT